MNKLVNKFRPWGLAWAVLASGCMPVLAEAQGDPQALARRTGLDEAVVRLTLDTGRNAQPLRPGTQAPPRPGLTVQVTGGHATAQAEWLRRQLPPDHVVFISQRRFGIDRQPDDVSVIRAKDPFEPLRAMRTHGSAYELSARRVLAKLRDWDRRYGVQLIGAGPDWLELRLRNLPDRLRKFSIEVYEFCPDVVNDIQSVDRVAEELQLTRTLHLRWGLASPAWTRPSVVPVGVAWARP